MTPGIYILSRDIVNPKPDRRYWGNWLARPVWLKGWKFIVNGSVLDCVDFPATSPVREEHLSAISLLVRSLKPSTSTRDQVTWLFMEHEHTIQHHAVEVLIALVDSGVLSLEDVRHALTNLNNPG